MKKVIRYDKDGVHVVGAINLAASEGDEATHVSSRQRVRVVQRNGETVVHEDEGRDEVSEGSGSKHDG
jgi:hypothetical protein